MSSFISRMSVFPKIDRSITIQVISPDMDPCSEFNTLAVRLKEGNLDHAVYISLKGTNPKYVAKEIQKCLQNLLDAHDIEPVEHGHWIDTGEVDEDGNRVFRCSNCAKLDTQSPAVNVPRCWFCGAKMDYPKGD
jgi:hypothetical protein